MIRISMTITFLILTHTMTMFIFRYVKNLIKFDRMFTLYKNSLREIDCPERLRALYRRVENYKPNCVTQYQEESIKSLLEIIETKIIIKES